MSSTIEKIELTLVDLSSLYNDDGDQKRTTNKTDSFINKVDSILSTLSCRSAAAPSDNNDSSKIREKLRHDILRFVQQRDAHLALSSILLKSRAFHATRGEQQHHQQQQQRQRPALALMDLPRTKHKKPYIPSTGSSGGGGGNHVGEEDDDMTAAAPISLSHQFPFVGLVRFVRKQHEEEEDADLNKLFLGLDIVCFDIVQPRDLYPNTLSFIEVFRDSFAPPEWNIIQSAATQDNGGDDVMLHEFCLRWAVKEAYTKALGVGLGFDFASFQVVFDNADLAIHDDTTKNSTTTGRNPFLWKWLLHNACKDDSNSNKTHQQQQTLVGTVLVMPPKQGKVVDPDLPVRPKREEWMFSFRLLYKQEDSDNRIIGDNGERTVRTPLGCACTAWGPLLSSSSETDDDDCSSSTRMILRVENQWTTVDELVAWHVQA